MNKIKLGNRAITEESKPFFIYMNTPTACCGDASVRVLN
jgi:hypothetical protein